MKIFRKILRYWIAFASILTFLGGWIILAHSPKPVMPASAQATAQSTLPPIQAFGSNPDNTSPGFFQNNSQSFPGRSSGLPLLRTRGS
jgi:hypothetical protein